MWTLSSGSVLYVQNKSESNIFFSNVGKLKGLLGATCYYKSIILE